ncbi:MULTISPECIES: sensor protein KdpD [Olivibacter]|jgi:two-component system sensor histidine kinase KdpD|uniref:Osmosensitive K channel His kinase sensor n=3 Tax=Sphingobacteriaceae TaxID=84566 RepID=F4C639_SPHS2|nr:MULTISPECIES: sensor protein KdpD [Olivibacter]MCL4639001.1 sensor protein KdpD [Olivibacter sp. UJ_SKK_5.1]MDM8172904.1 sensor protein KdpD [Olivibacter sp. 47]MDX3915630.1 sensor protein KdpD [Pseudosphingobacterium sp.]QEL02769.1 sensor protein KdpD [Olivibacter sp. LS-1]
MEEENQQAAHFLDLIKKSRQGKFKVYIGMSAGVGKTYRMLQEAHMLLRNGIDVKIAYVETHNRTETQALLAGLPIIQRRKLFYRGKELEELDVQGVLNLRPEVVIIDELAHTNIEGSKNEKRWQDVLEIIESGINVISAVNIQHIESLNDDIRKITGIEVKERIPDKIITLADEVVNIDLTADELIDRLKEGKIYTADKIETALQNFFRNDHILQLRELALKEVAGHVERKVDAVVPPLEALRSERFLACISSNEQKAKTVIRKTARLASYYNGQWYVLYVQTPKEATVKIPLDKQRYLINNLKLATELGGTVLQIQHKNVPLAISELAIKYKVTTVCIGKPRLNLFRIILATGIFNQLLRKLSDNDIDLIILS